MSLAELELSNHGSPVWKDVGLCTDPHTARDLPKTIRSKAKCIW